ncbi:MAG: Spy/CpxP family protein refolding chaperone [Rhodanobacter sp.]
MRKSITLSLVLASAMALTSLAVVAQDGGPHGGWHHGHGGQGMEFSKLNLTDAQRASIKQIMQSSFGQNKTQRQALQQQRQAFEAMTPDQAGYQAAATSLGQAEATALQARVQQRATVQTQIYAVLTATQKMQLATIKAQQQARKQQWEQFKAQNPVSNSSSSTN